MPLTIKNKIKLAEGKFIKVWATHFLDKSGKEQIWEWVEKKNFVVIFPITDDNKIVLIKNFRIPIEKYVIEMVAGRLDKTGENEVEAAKRELFEETGYEAKNMYPVKKFAHAAGTTNNFAHAFIATGCHKVADVQGDETEDIVSIMEIPADKLTDYYLESPDDVLFNISTFGLLHIAQTKGFIH